MRMLFGVPLAIGLLTACSTVEPPSPMPSTAVTAAPGTISFGRALNGRTQEIRNPETTFRLNQQVAWSASLPAPVEGTKVNIVIRDSSGHELFGYEQFITDPGATTLANRMPLGRFLPEPGSYVMQYVTLTGEILAEGEFELVAASN